MESSVGILPLEERALTAWPALETVMVGGWALRFSSGCTKRANSANALRPSTPFDEVRAAAETLYSARSLTPIFRISPLAQPDADEILERAGYQLLEPSLVLTAPLEVLADSMVGEIDDAPSAEWLQGYADASGMTDAMRPRHAAIVRAIKGPAAFLTVRGRGEPVGFGLAVCERGQVGLFDIVVSSAMRGRGYGRQITRALLSWGRRTGAHGAYLQVHHANELARSLYRSLGFTQTYAYHYRVAPR